MHYHQYSHKIVQTMVLDIYSGWTIKFFNSLSVSVLKVVLTVGSLPAIWHSSILLGDAGQNNWWLKNKKPTIKKKTRTRAKLVTNREMSPVTPMTDWGRYNTNMNMLRLDHILFTLTEITSKVVWKNLQSKYSKNINFNRSFSVNDKS